jgi:site-specific recombinase XerD
MARALDSSDLWAPDSWLSTAWAPDSERSRVSLGRAIELFLAAKGAEGASPKTIQWYRMVLGRAARDLGGDRPLDALTPAEVRDWLLTLRETLAPISVAGYVRGCKVLGNWCAAEELAEAKALRSLRRPRVPHKLVEPLSDEALRRLLDGASGRDRAILLLFLDTGLRLSELACQRRRRVQPAAHLGPFDARHG